MMSHEHHGVSIHRQLDFLLNNLPNLTAEVTSKLCITFRLWRVSTDDPWIPLTKSGNTGSSSI